jgi:hypothetical protein
LVQRTPTDPASAFRIPQLAAEEVGLLQSRRPCGFSPGYDASTSTTLVWLHRGLREATVIFDLGAISRSPPVMRCRFPLLSSVPLPACDHRSAWPGQLSLSPGNALGISPFAALFLPARVWALPPVFPTCRLLTVHLDDLIRGVGRLVPFHPQPDEHRPRSRRASFGERNETVDRGRLRRGFWV